MQWEPFRKIFEQALHIVPNGDDEVTAYFQPGSAGQAKLEQQLGYPLPSGWRGLTLYALSQKCPSRGDPVEV